MQFLQDHFLPLLLTLRMRECANARMRECAITIEENCETLANTEWTAVDCRIEDNLIHCKLRSRNCCDSLCDVLGLLEKLLFALIRRKGKSDFNSSLSCDQIASEEHSLCLLNSNSMLPEAGSWDAPAIWKFRTCVSRRITTREQEDNQFVLCLASEADRSIVQCPSHQLPPRCHERPLLSAEMINARTISVRTFSEWNKLVNATVHLDM
jgi:hypothetical protein